MPYFAFFADGQDLNLLLDRFNADPENAFIVPDGPLDPEVAYVDRLRASMRGRTEAVTFFRPFGVADDGYRQRWKAVRPVESLKDGAHCLWHIPSGPLPMIAESGPHKVISDPWGGWTEQRQGGNPMVPYFEDHPAVIHLELWSRHRPYTEEKPDRPILDARWDRQQDLLAASSLQWIGGRSPPPQTRRWWNRLKAWLGRSTARIDAGGRQTFWAFPSALRKLKDGMAYDAWNWDLSRGIQAAEVEFACPRARDLFPARPVSLDPAWLRWRDGTVVRLAQAAYEGRRADGTLEPGRLAVLADALEEAGCPDPVILAHLREPGAVHVRGCFVVDTLLRRS